MVERMKRPSPLAMAARGACREEWLGHDAVKAQTLQTACRATGSFFRRNTSSSTVRTLISKSEGDVAAHHLHILSLLKKGKTEKDLKLASFKVNYQKKIYLQTGQKRALSVV